MDGGSLVAICVGMIQRDRFAIIRIRECAALPILQQIDRIALAEGQDFISDGTRVERHVLGIDLRLARILGREEDIAALRGGGQRERVCHAFDGQEEALAIRRQRARRCDRGRVVVVRVDNAFFCGAGIRQFGVLFLFRQQLDLVALFEGEDFVGLQFHIRSVDRRVCRVNEREEGAAAIFRGNVELERIRHAVQGQLDFIATNLHQARLRDDCGTVACSFGGVGVLIEQLAGIVVVQRRGWRAVLLHFFLIFWVELRRYSLPPVLRYMGGIAALAQTRSLGDGGERRRIPDPEAVRIRDVDLAVRCLGRYGRVREGGCTGRRIDLQRIRRDVAGRRRVSAQDDGRGGDIWCIQRLPHRKRVRHVDTPTRRDIARCVDGARRDVAAVLIIIDVLRIDIVRHKVAPHRDAVSLRCDIGRREVALHIDLLIHIDLARCDDTARLRNDVPSLDIPRLEVAGRHGDIIRQLFVVDVARCFDGASREGSTTQIDITHREGILHGNSTTVFTERIHVEVIRRDAFYSERIRLEVVYR